MNPLAARRGQIKKSTCRSSKFLDYVVVDDQVFKQRTLVIKGILHEMYSLMEHIILISDNAINEPHAPDWPFALWKVSIRNSQHLSMKHRQHFYLILNTKFYDFAVSDQLETKRRLSSAKGYILMKLLRLAIGVKLQMKTASSYWFESNASCGSRGIWLTQTRLMRHATALHNKRTNFVNVDRYRAALHNDWNRAQRESPMQPVLKTGPPRGDC